MSRWRRRVGEAGAGELLKETIECGLRMKVIKPSELRRVNVDTTVQEKHIRFPTDARLYDRMRQRLVAAAREEGVALRQSYVEWASICSPSRVATPTPNSSEGRADAPANCAPSSAGSSATSSANYPIRANGSADLLALAKRLHRQRRHDKGKLYSVHAPEVECISKGKAHKRYEFGCKVALAVTSKGGWVLAARSLEGNPYDGHTLRGTMDRIVATSGTEPEHAYCDMNYRGHDYEGECEIHVGQPEAGIDRQERVALDEAAGGDRAFHRASQGGEADGEVPAQGDGGRQGQRRPQRGGDELLQAPCGPRSFAVVFAGSARGALCPSFAP